MLLRLIRYVNGHFSHESKKITGFRESEIEKKERGGCSRTDKVRDVIFSKQRRKPEKMTIRVN